MQLVGAAATLTLDALSYLWSALMVSLISAADEPPSSIKRPHPLRDIASSFVTWRKYGPLVAMGACVFINNVGSMAVRTTLLLVAYRAFGLQPVAAGWIFAIGGFATVLGATTATRLTAKLGIGRALIAATTADLVWVIAPLGLVFSPLIVLGVASLVAGTMLPVWNVNAVTVRQRLVAPHEQGRVIAIARAIATAGVALGAVFGGVAATILGNAFGDQVGLVMAMSIAALVAGVSAIPLLLGGIGSLRLPTSSYGRT